MSDSLKLDNAPNKEAEDTNLVEQPEDENKLKNPNNDQQEENCVDEEERFWNWAFDTFLPTNAADENEGSEDIYDPDEDYVLPAQDYFHLQYENRPEDEYVPRDPWQDEYEISYSCHNPWEDENDSYSD
ncbi:hypothetical protein E3N88_30590 [Mikania micrantha]|uniref:Uncharacterized protein n=1 Tax=Mikania micrantha TaxID=192012 RepID=A0A5N6MMT7_9ASTR|nr:hypothetical protein E3N88_30590 [Mikania micrantha]